MTAMPPPGLRKALNGADLPSPPAALMNTLLPVHMRNPGPLDNGPFYTAGSSLWIGPKKEVFQYQGNRPIGGSAIWQRLPNPGPYAGGAASGVVFARALQRVYPGYTGPLAVIVRSSDASTYTLAQLGDGRPDLSGLAQFLQPTGGIGYVAYSYEQSGTGVTTTQAPYMANMPRVDLSMARDGYLPMDWDGSRRGYYTSPGFPVAYSATWTSGNTIQMGFTACINGTCSINGTTATLSINSSLGSNGYFYVGQVLSGAGITTGTTLVKPLTLIDGAGSGTWQVSISQTVTTPVAVTGSATSLPVDIVPGFLIGGTGIATATFYGTVSAGVLTVQSISSGTLATGQCIFGGTANMVLGTNISGGSAAGSTWNVTNGGTMGTSTQMVAQTVATAINYTSGVITLSTTPTASPGSTISFLPQMIYEDIPNSIQVPWQGWSFVHAANWSVSGTGVRPLTMGVHPQDPPNNAGSFSGIYSGSPAANDSAGFRVYSGNNIGSGSQTWPVMISEMPQAFGFAIGGSNPKALLYQVEGVPTATTYSGANPPSATLSGGSIGGNRQFTQQLNGAYPGGDYLDWGLVIYSSALTAAQITQVTASFCIQLGWVPQVAFSIFSDGSSTTGGNGTLSGRAWSSEVMFRLQDVLPLRPYVIATGGGPSFMATNAPALAALVPPAQRGLAVIHPGWGNGLQPGGAFVITNQVISGNSATLTFAVNGANLNGFDSDYLYVTGKNAGGAIVTATDTFTTAFNQTAGTVTISPAPSDVITSLQACGNSARQSFILMRDYYLPSLVSLGYGPIVLIMSAARALFWLTTLPLYGNELELVEFNTLTVLVRENWQQLPGVVGVIFLEDDPLFGADPTGPMVVQSVNVGAKTITVQGISQYCAAPNRIWWTGMPNSITNNTGGQTITNVSGNVITVSGAPTGLAPGSLVNAINPAPWSANVGTDLQVGWPLDRQHFSKLAYWRTGEMTADYLISNKLLP